MSDSSGIHSESDDRYDIDLPDQDPIEQAFRTQTLEKIFNSQEYTSIVEEMLDQEKHVVKAEKGISYQHEISIKSYADSKNSFFSSRVTSISLTHDQIEMLQTCIIDKFLNIQSMSSEIYWSQKSLDYQSITITRNLIDEISCYVRSIIKSGTRLRDGLNNLILCDSDEVRNEATLLHKNLQQVLGQYENMEAELKHQLVQDQFVNLLNAVMLNLYQEPYFNVLNFIGKILIENVHFEKVKAFISVYKFYASSLNFSQEVQLEFSKHNITSDENDNLTQKFKNLKMHLGQSSGLYHTCNQFKSKVIQQVKGHLQGREPVEFNYLEFKNYFTNSDADSVSIFNMNQKGDVADQHYIEILPFLIGKEIENWINIFQEQQKTNTIISEINDVDLELVAKQVLKVFRQLQLNEITKDLEANFLTIVEKYSIKRQVISYQHLLNFLDTSLDKSILDDLDIFTNFNTFKSQSLAALSQLQYSIERLFFISLCENVTNQFSYQEILDQSVQMISEGASFTLFLQQVNDYIQLKELFVFVETFKQGVDIMYNFIETNPEQMDSSDEQLKLRDSFKKFKEEGFICNSLRNNNLTPRHDHSTLLKDLQKHISKIITAHPIIQKLSLDYSFDKTVLTVTDSRIETTEDPTDAKVLFEQISSEQNPIDIEASFLYSNQRTKKTYSPHDPFSVIPFISKKQILLYRSQFARGINKQQFLFINEIFTQNSKIQVVYENFIQIDQILQSSVLFDLFTDSFKEEIDKNLKQKTIKNFSKILLADATASVFPQAFQYLNSRISAPGFNPTKFTKSADSDPSPITLNSPFLPESSVPGNAIREFAAAQKGFRICVAIPQNVITEAIDGINQQNMTSFVVVDSSGRFLDSLSLKTYENMLPNPQNFKADDGVLAKLFENLLNESGVDRQDMGDCLINKKKLNDLITKYFIELNQKQLQRIIDEASLMDFLAKNAVCAVGVYQWNFSSQKLKRNLENTLKYMNLPIPEYYNEDGLVSADKQELYLEFVSCPKKGREMMIGQNLLYLNDFIFKRVKLGQFLQKIILVDIASDIVFQTRNMVDFDLSFEDTDLFSSIKDHSEAYLKSSKDYIVNILKNIVISKDQEEITRNFGQFNNYWNDKKIQQTNKFKLQLLSFDPNVEPPIQKSKQNDEIVIQQLQFTGLKNSQVIDNTAKQTSGILLGIQAARYLLDPLSIICLLTQGEAMPENFINTNLAGFLPQFMPFNGLDNNEVYLPICDNPEMFYLSIKQQLAPLSQFIQQLAVSKKGYDFNLGLSSPHYIYALTLLPGLSSRKLVQIYQRMSTADSLNDKLLKLSDIQRLLYLYNKRDQIQQAFNSQYPLQEFQSQQLEKTSKDISLNLDSEINNMISKIEDQSNKNIFGEYVEQKRNKQKYGYFIQNKQELQSIILEIVIAEHLQQLVITQESQEKGLSNLTYKQICQQSADFALKIKQYPIFNQFELKEKFGYEKNTSFDSYMKTIILSQDIFDYTVNSLIKRPIGQLVVDLFKTEDFLLVNQTMQNYNSLLKSIVVTPDNFLTIPGSPYASPINISYYQEFPEPITTQILFTFNEFLKGRFQIECYDYNKVISDLKIQKQGGPESRKIIIGAVLNKYGTDNQLFGLLDVDEETTIGKKYKNYCCYSIQDNIIDSLSLYDRVQISENETAYIYFAILFAQKYGKADLFEQIESKYIELQEISNLIMFYNNFNLFQDEVVQLNQRSIFIKYDLLYQIFGSQSTIVKDLYEVFEQYQSKLKNNGVFLEQTQQIQLLFTLEQKINFTFDTLPYVYKSLFNSELDDLISQQDQYFKQQFVNGDQEDEEIYNILELVQDFKKYVNHSIVNIHDQQLKAHIEQAIQSGFIADVFKKDSFRKELSIIVEHINQFDSNFKDILEKVEISQKSSKNSQDCIYKTSKFIDEYSRHNGNLVVNFASFDLQDNFKSDEKLIFLIQSKLLNPKQFTRFQEFKVEVPMMKRDTYRNQTGLTSIDIECLSIPGLKGSIPNGGNEEDVDLYGAFTCYLDGVDFGQSQVFLITYFVIKDENNNDSKLKVSNFISNIHENIWRAALLEQIISTESSLKRNMSLIADNVNNLIPSSMGQSQFNPKQYGRFQTYQTQNMNPQYLKKHDLQQFQGKPVQSLIVNKLFTNKLVLSYQLSDFYQLNINNENDQQLDSYFKSASLQSIGLHYFLQNSSQFINIRQNQQCVAAILAQAQKFFIDNEKQKTPTDLFNNSPNSLRVFKANFIDQLSNFNAQIHHIDVDQVQNYEEILTLLKLFYQFFFCLKQSNLSAELFQRHMKFIQTPQYLKSYKNYMQASFQQVQFKREIQHPQFKVLKLNEVSVYFEKYSDKKCVFIPVQGSFDQIQVCIQTPRKDQNDYKFSAYTIYEDPNYKPQENGQSRSELLSQQLYINLFENFPNLEQKRLTYNTLEEINANFVHQIYKQYENFKQTTKLINYSQKQDVINIRKSDWACYFSDCRKNRLNLIKLSSSRTPIIEAVYISMEGFIFRDKFIPAKKFIQNFIQEFYSNNYQTFEKKGSQLAHTIYKEVE